MGCIGLSCTERVKPMNRRRKRFRSDERGGAEVLVLALFGAVFAVILLVASTEWMLQSVNKSRSKLALDRAAHAAALYTDREAQAYGRLEWDESAGRAAFEQLMRLNFQLDEHLSPIEGSRLEAAPVVHALEFVTADVYPARISRTVVVRAGQYGETTRRVDATIYGPSVIAVVEVHQRVRGVPEPIVLSSVASVRFR